MSPCTFEGEAEKTTLLLPVVSEAEQCGLHSDRHTLQAREEQMDPKQTNSDFRPLWRLDAGPLVALWPLRMGCKLRS